MAWNSASMQHQEVLHTAEFTWACLGDTRVVKLPEGCLWVTAGGFSSTSPGEGRRWDNSWAVGSMVPPSGDASLAFRSVGGGFDLRGSMRSLDPDWSGRPLGCEGRRPFW